MQKPYINQLSLSHKLKGVPYGGSGEIHDDGDANYGFVDIKGNNDLLLEIPELKRDHRLMSLVKMINAPHTGLFTIGCVSGPVCDENGFRHSGYVEFSINSASAIADAINYFSLFFHFDRMLHESGFSTRVTFDWELQPVAFINANVTGFTCSIIVNTHYSKTKEDAEAAWTEALEALQNFLSGVPKERSDSIFGK